MIKIQKSDLATIMVRGGSKSRKVNWPLYGPRRLFMSEIQKSHLATLVQGRYFIAKYQESDLATLT